MRASESLQFNDSEQILGQKQIVAECMASFNVSSHHGGDSINWTMVPLKEVTEFNFI